MKIIPGKLPLPEHVRVGIRQGAVFYSLCRFFYIVFKPDKFHLDAFLI